MQQLTDEDIAKVFHLYHNANVTTKWQIDANGYNYGAFKYWYIQHEQIMVHPTGLCNNVVATDAKLLLTPLSKITDEHKNSIANLYAGDWCKIDDDTFLQVIKQDGTVVRWFILSQDLPSMLFQYFTKEGVAVPLFFGINHWANGKTAIELGIAIDKTLSND